MQRADLCDVDRRYARSALRGSGSPACRSAHTYRRERVVAVQKFVAVGLGVGRRSSGERYRGRSGDDELVRSRRPHARVRVPRVSAWSALELESGDHRTMVAVFPYVLFLDCVTAAGY